MNMIIGGRQAGFNSSFFTYWVAISTSQLFHSSDYYVYEIRVTLYTSENFFFWFWRAYDHPRVLEELDIWLDSWLRFMTVKGYREGSTREKDVSGVVWRSQAQASSILLPRATPILLLPSARTYLPAFQTFRRKAHVLRKSQCLYKHARQAGTTEPNVPGGQSCLSVSNLGTLREAKFSDASVGPTPQAGPSDSRQLW